MSEVECFKIKVKSNHLPRVKEWADYLKERSKEVKALLKKEGMDIESVFLDSAPDGDYLVYYVRAQDLAKTRKASAESKHEIDEYHRKVMGEIRESFSRLECLIDFSTLSESP